jgi:hypothetical protein
VKCWPQCALPWMGSGGLGRNGVRSGSPSQPTQSPGAKQCTTSTPPGKEKTALARGGSGSTSVLSPRKLDGTSRKAEKEHSLTETPTAKRVQGDSVVIGRSKQNRSVKHQGTGKLVPTENSCPLLASTDVLHPSKPGQFPMSTLVLRYWFLHCVVGVRKQ